MRFVLFILTLGASTALFIKDINADDFLFLVFHILNSLLIFTIEKISNPFFTKLKGTNCKEDIEELCNKTPLVVLANPFIVLFLQISGILIVAMQDVSMLVPFMYLIAGRLGRSSFPKKKLTNLPPPDMDQSSETHNPEVNRAIDILEDILNRIYKRETTGRKTQYPVIVKKIEDGYFLCIPDMREGLFMNGDIIPAIEAEIFLHKTISRYKENNRNLPFSSLIEENMLSEGESLLYVQSFKSR